jgi:site-specific recombinase XerD
MITKITKVYFDFGPPIELPVLFTEDGRPFEPLVRCQVSHAARSLSWHRRLVLSVRLFLEYAAVNSSCGGRRDTLFENFCYRLEVGSMEEGLDPSGLYWLARKPCDAASLRRMLSVFAQYMATYFGSAELNPMRLANWRERICRYAGQCYQRDRHFLAHLHSKAKTWEDSKYVESHYGRNRRAPRVEGALRYQFPKERVGDLMMRGFAVRRDVENPVLRLNIRDVAITVLLHGGGIRCAEAFHMYVNDVIPNPLDESSALIRIGHPRLGEIRWRDPSGRIRTTTRAVYLSSHGLPQREIVAGPMHAGWKNPLLDGNYYLQVRWAEPRYGRLFLDLWRIYIAQYLALPERPMHPWAWVSFAKGHVGEPLKLGRYRAAHDRAVQRIGLDPRRNMGTRPHNHRHSYAKWLEEIGLSQQHIRRMLHHESLGAQGTYKQVEEIEMHNAMEKGLARIRKLGSTLILNDESQRDTEANHAASLQKSNRVLAEPWLDELQSLVLKSGRFPDALP